MEDLIMIACAFIALTFIGYALNRLVMAPRDELTDEDYERIAKQYDHDIPAGLAVLDREPARNIFAGTSKESQQ